MRLTHVDQLSLPFGRLHSYQVQASAPGTAVPVSFDQNRHVSAGERPGSWMAISISLPGAVNHEDLAQAWLQVIARHGTLRTTFSTGVHGEVQAHRIWVGAGAWVEHPIAPGESITGALRHVLNRRCSPYSRPAHTLCIIDADPRPTVVIAADHSHVDMWSMLVIVRDLLGILAGGGDAELPADPPAFGEHTAELLAAPPAPAQVHQRWREILEAGGGRMPQFPLPLGDAVSMPERVEVRDIFGVNDLALYSARARAAEVSTLAQTTSIMAEVTRDLADQPLRAVFPVHSRSEERWHDSVGWFITNSVIEVADAGPQAAARAVREAVQLGSHPLAELLAPWGGMPETPGMFAISWLDLRRLPVSIDDIGLDAQYVSAATRTDGVMLWFILDRAGAHLRCRYPDTTQARHNVGRWLDAVVARMRARVDGVALNGGYVLSRGSRADAPEIAHLLGTREPLADPGPAQLLAVVRDSHGELVAAMQLSILPDLIRGHLRMHLDGPHVAPHLQGGDLAEQMRTWASGHARSRGAQELVDAWS